MKLIRVGLDGGGTGWAVLWVDENGEEQLTLLTPPPEPTRPQVRWVDEPIRFKSAQFERSLQRTRTRLAAKRRSGSTDARDLRAAGQVFRSLRRFNVLRHRPAPGRVKARAQAAPRSRRTRGTASSRDRPRKPEDDDDVGDARRRCSRCGGVAQPVPGSALWTCDYCAGAISGQIVQRDVEHVLTEAERILRGESA